MEDVIFLGEMKLDMLLLLGPQRKDDEGTERWKKETEKLVSLSIFGFDICYFWSMCVGGHY